MPDIETYPLIYVSFTTMSDYAWNLSVVELDRALSFMHLRLHSVFASELSFDEEGICRMKTRDVQDRSAAVIAHSKAHTHVIRNSRNRATALNHIDAIVLLQ